MKSYDYLCIIFFMDGMFHCIRSLHVMIKYFTRFYLRTTLFTEYTVLTKLQEDSGNSDFSSLFSYNNFRLGWYSYLSLLEINYEDGFKCITCGDQPKVVVMDATSLAFRRELDSWNECLCEPKLSVERFGSRYVNEIGYSHTGIIFVCIHIICFNNCYKVSRSIIYLWSTQPYKKSFQTVYIYLL